MGKMIIKALTGPIKGQTFDLKNGLTLGREHGDIILKDSSVSNLHAEIQIYSSGQVMIIDKDSKNKIYVNNKKTVKSVLEENNRFKIGKSEFIVKFVKTPQELLLEFLSKVNSKVTDNPLDLKPFFKPVTIQFSSGIQKGKEYKVYYGPRIFGKRSVDFPILDKKSPEKCFVLMPDKQKIIFKTSYPEQVKYNNKNLEKTKIQDGDQIFIGYSTLKIKLG